MKDSNKTNFISNLEKEIDILYDDKENYSDDEIKSIIDSV